MTFDPSSYGRLIAQDYDELYADLPTGVAVETLASLAAGGPVLELGVGTGRLALPLRARGLEVHGIEGSPEMAQQLRAKPGGEEIPVTVGDFAEVRAGTDFALAFVSFNTIYALPSQDAQVRCFRNVAAQLRPGGLFAVEAWILDVGAFRDGKAVRPVQVGDGRVVLEVAELHPAEQLMRSDKVFLDGRGVRVFPANHRYAWPTELDLMARLAGLTLLHRWEDWGRRPYDDRSGTHVSVWRKDHDGPW
jgi:SAM-dependent methyltransferase